MTLDKHGQRLGWNIDYTFKSNFCPYLRGNIGFVERFEIKRAEIPTAYLKSFEPKTEVKYMSKESVHCGRLVPFNADTKLSEVFENAIK